MKMGCDSVLSSESVGNLALVPVGFQQFSFRSVEEAGLFYEVAWIRDRLTLKKDPGPAVGANYYTHFLLGNVDSTPITELDPESFDPDDDYYLHFLEGLDPTAWKDQDHYRVLGLSQLRWSASEGQIRTAYRQKVLKHHPDKRRGAGKPVKDSNEDYFTCITRAYETLTVKRRAYDSIDPLFDDATPSPSTKNLSESFFAIFAPVFERNERFSRRQPVPKLGDNETDFADVENFYSFWYSFDSWREFSYLDEEDKEKGDNRFERRCIDKENKAAREQRRKEEVKRIRALVDLSYANDPRIQRFKSEEKRKKEEIKQAKLEAQRQKKAEEAKKLKEAEETAKREKAEEEERERQKAQAEKKERDLRKKALQKEKKQLESLLKDRDFFASSAEERLQRMEDLHLLFNVLSLEELREVNTKMSAADEDAAPAVFAQSVNEAAKQASVEREEFLRSGQKDLGSEASVVNGGHESKWTDKEVQLLVKAMTVFPVGTKSRWDVIAAFINEHAKAASASDFKEKTGKDVVAKVKDLQSLNVKAHKPANASLPSTKELNGDMITAEPSVRSETPAELLGGTAWSAEEQKLFEQALRTFGASTPDRWDRIAEVLKRPKKECMKRYKELAELVQAKKAAQEKVAGMATGKTK